jgi:hypothetical protein
MSSGLKKNGCFWDEISSEHHGILFQGAIAFCQHIMLHDARLKFP